MSLKGFERWGRRALEPFLKLLLLPRRTAPLPESPRRILVVRVDNRLGNLVMLTSLLNALRERFPEAEVSLLLSSGFHGILEGQGWRLIPVDKKAMIWRPWRLAGLARKLRSTGFEAVVDASHPHGFSLSSAVVTALTGCPVRIGSPLGASPGWYTHSPAGMPGPDQHESRALHALGVVWPRWPRWSPPRLLLPRKPGDRVIGLHPGAKGGKAFPDRFFHEVAKGLAELGPVHVFWGSQREGDLAGLLQRSGAVAMPRMSPARFAAEVSGMAVLVCPDSGPMHVASAMGVPVVALFRRSDGNRFGPLSPGSVVLVDPGAGDVVDRVGDLLGSFQR